MFCYFKLTLCNTLDPTESIIRDSFYYLFHLETSYGYYTRGAFLWTDGCTVVELGGKLLKEQQVFSFLAKKSHVLNGTIAGKLNIAAKHNKVSKCI